MLITPEWIDELIAQQEANLAFLKVHLFKLIASPGDQPQTPPDPIMAFALSPAEIIHDEGDSGTTTYQYTVTRSVVTTGSASVNWNVDGYGVNSANATDFGGSFPSGTVNFADGESVKTFDVLVSGDATVEQDEAFLVTLSNPSSGVITTSTALGTITNDDSAPPPGSPQALTLPDLQWGVDTTGTTGAATGWANGVYNIVPGVTMTVSSENYSLSGAPY